MKTIAKLAFITAILGAPLSSYAASHSAAPASTASSVNETTEGEVRKVDKDAKKITIRHAELKQLEMPAMTMVFQVKDLSLLEKVRQGDKVTFVAEKMGGQFTVTQIEAKQ
jgi:Cu(I)/Ag(I) efflux system periplasmic protein CusF